MSTEPENGRNPSDEAGSGAMRWSPLRIALTYGALGAGWVLLSDHLLLWLTADGSFLELTLFQNAKAVAFVVASGGVLFLLAREHTRQLAAEHDRGAARDHLYRSLVDGVGDHAFFAVDGAGRIASWNAGAERVFGMSPERALGRPLAALFESAPEAGRQLLDAVAAGGSGRFEGWLTREDGAKMWVEMRLKALEADPAGALSCIVHDRTERRVVEAQLEEAEQRFRDFAEYASDLLWETDSELALSYFSDGTAKMLARDGREAVGRPWWDAFAAARAPWERMRELMKTRRPFRNFEVEFVDIAGHTASFVLTGIPVFGASGEFAGYRGTGSDLTRWREAELALRRTTDDLQALFDQELVGVTVTGFDGRYIRVNEAFAAMLGYAAEDLIGRHFSEVSAPEHLTPANLDLRGRYTTTAGTRQHERCYVGKDGSRVWGDVFTQRVLDKDGTPSRLISIIVNVTQRRALEAERRAHDARLRAIIDNSPALIYLKDVLGRYLVVNRRVCELRNRPESEFIGRTVREVEPPEIATLSEELDRRVLAERRQIELEREANVPGHGRIVLRSIRFPILDEHGEISSICGIDLDITQSKRYEEHLRRIDRLDAVQGLTGGIAHDFNNLLAVILGNLQLIQRRIKDDGRVSEMAAAAIRSVQRGADLTKQLLAYSSHQALDLETFDINAILRDLDSLLGRTLGENIEIQVKLAADLWPAKTDAKQLQAALINLAVNARDAMPNGGTLTIETMNATLDSDYASGVPDAVPGPYVMIAVSDTGTGMSRDVIRRVFEPFFTTKPPGKGTGLGLPMVYGFIKQLGGHVHVYSEVGRGTTFRLYLPRAAAGAAGAAFIDAPASGELPTGDERVLLVEDDDAARATAKLSLEDLGYSVVEAASGPQALNVLAKAHGVALLFTDVVMPGGMSGAELVEKARSLRPDIKVVFASGYPKGATADVWEGDGYLTKPYTREELSQTIRRALDRR